MQIIAYIKNFGEISKENCEKYLLQFGIKAQIHPEIDFETDSGFMPFKVEFPAIDALKDGVFLSGFEIYTDVYKYQKKMFQKFIVNPEIDDVLKSCGYSISLVYHDCAEGVMALAFASYLAESGNGIVHEVESGEYYYQEIRRRVYEDIKDFFDILEPDVLTPFEGWSKE